MSHVEQVLVAQKPSTRFPARLRRDFMMPLATIAALVALVLVAGVHFGVRALNDESAAREMQLVRNGLEQRIEEVAELVVPQTEWDDAVRHLDNHFDPVWAAANINEFLDHAHGFDAAVVLDPADKPIFVSFDGEAVETARYTRISAQAANLVSQVRRKEAARGPLRRETNNPDLISKAIQASTLKTIRGELLVLTATLVQPDFGTAMPSGPRAPIVVTAMRIDKPFLTQFSRRFLLDDVDVRLPTQTPTEGRIEVPVRDDAGRVQAWLNWRPLDPGYGMLHRMALPFLAALLAVMIFALIELRRIFRSARELIERDEMSDILFWPLDEDTLDDDLGDDQESRAMAVSPA